MSWSRSRRWWCDDLLPLALDGVVSVELAINFCLASIKEFAAREENCVVNRANGEVGSWRWMRASSFSCFSRGWLLQSRYNVLYVVLKEKIFSNKICFVYILVSYLAELLQHSLLLGNELAVSLLRCLQLAEALLFLVLLFSHFYENLLKQRVVTKSDWSNLEVAEVNKILYIKKYFLFISYRSSRSARLYVS